MLRFMSCVIACYLTGHFWDIFKIKAPDTYRFHLLINNKKGHLEASGVQFLQNVCKLYHSFFLLVFLCELPICIQGIK